MRAVNRSLVTGLLATVIRWPPKAKRLLDEGRTAICIHDAGTGGRVLQAESEMAGPVLQRIPGNGPRSVMHSHGEAR